MSDLTREQILAAAHAQADERVPLEVPEWGGTVYVRLISAKEQANLADVPQAEIVFRALTLALVDVDGNRLFEDEEAELLGRQSGKLITGIGQKVLALNGMTEEAEEEAVRDFARTNHAADSSGSLSPSADLLANLPRN